MNYKELELTLSEAESTSDMMGNAAQYLFDALETTISIISDYERRGPAPHTLYSRKRSLIAAIGLIQDARKAWDEARDHESTTI